VCEQDPDEYAAVLLGKMINRHCGDASGSPEKGMRLFQDHVTVFDSTITGNGECEICEARRETTHDMCSEGVIELKLDDECTPLDELLRYHVSGVDTLTLNCNDCT